MSDSKRYASADNAMAAIREALGPYADQYDVGAILTETHEWRCSIDSDGQQVGSAWLAQAVSDEEFWTVVARHERTTSA